MISHAYEKSQPSSPCSTASTFIIGVRRHSLNLPNHNARTCNSLTNENNPSHDVAIYSSGRERVTPLGIRGRETTWANETVQTDKVSK